jgi:hypothetical protein
VTTSSERAFLDALQGLGIPKMAETELVQGGSRDKEVGTTNAPAVGGVTKANIWQHPDAHPIVLDHALVGRYGADWLQWEPETLQLSIPHDFNVPSLSDLNLEKLQACRTLHLVDSFWERWEVFLWCMMAFNGEFPDFRQMQVPAVGQVLIACDVASRIRDDVAWSEEVKVFIASVYEHDEIYLALPPANFVSIAAPDSVDTAGLLKAWPEVRASGKAPTGSTILDEQLRRLLSVNEYLEESRARLQRQLDLHV